MPDDVKLVLLFAVLHLVGLGLVTLLLVMFLRSETVSPWSPPHDDDTGGGGGGEPPEPGGPAQPPDGALPLSDARPAALRLREPGRLADARSPRDRRPAREPDRRPRPVSTPPREGSAARRGRRGH